MSTIPSYSSLFSCLYDEQEPIGSLGRGTHYSVFRAVEWLDVCRQPLTLPQVHDFAVIWDEDHDTRVIPVIEQIYMAGLLSPVQFIGERKGTLTVVVAARFYFHGMESNIQDYASLVNKIAQNASGDAWPADVGMFDRHPGSDHQNETHGLIMADDHRVQTYLRNIDSLWGLGTYPFGPQYAARG